MKAIKPVTVAINASSVCQLECPECPTVELRQKLKLAGESRYLRFDDFKKLLDKNPWLMAIEFSNHGELFLNPDLLEILRYAHEKGVRLSANSGVNLNKASSEILEALVKYRFSSMYVALDGATPESYRTYRVNGDFDAVIDNIKKINALKKEYGSNLPKLAWQFLVFGHNERELPLARSMAHELDMEFAPSLAFQFVDGHPVDAAFSPVRNADLMRKELGYSSLDEYRKKYGREHMQFACSMLWDSPLFNYDGTPWGCCVVGTHLLGDADFGGNAFADGLLESINSEGMQYARGMLTGKEEPRPEIPCSDCWLYLGRQAQGKWLRRNAVTNELWRAFNLYQAKLPGTRNMVKSTYRLLRSATSAASARRDARSRGK